MQLIPYPLFLVMIVSMESLAVAAVLFAFANLHKVWPSIPDTIAIHFGFDGKPDKWGSKRCLIMLPVAAAIIYAGFSAMQMWCHYSGQVSALMQLFVAAIKLEVICIFAFLQSKVLQVAARHAQRLGMAFIVSALVVPNITVITYVCMARYIH